MGGAGTDYVESIVQSIDGGYIGAGHSNSYGSGDYDVYIVKFDSGGKTCADTTSPSSQNGTGGTIASPTTTITVPSPTFTTTAPTIGAGGTVTTICTFTGIQPISNEIPKTFSLSQNYPNPFNPATKIKFSITAVGERHTFHTTLIVYNVLGKEIQTIVNQLLSPGTYEVNFDGGNLPSGVYYYKLQAGDFSETKRMVLLK